MAIYKSYHTDLLVPYHKVLINKGFWTDKGYGCESSIMLRFNRLHVRLTTIKLHTRVISLVFTIGPEVAMRLYELGLQSLWLYSPEVSMRLYELGLQSLWLY
jgi:hypothetical protein